MRATTSSNAIASRRRVERALWWAYERAPNRADKLFHFGRRHLIPMFRHRLPIQRLTGTARPGGPVVTMITTGAAMTLDVLAERFFSGAPRIESLKPVTLARLPSMLEQLAPTTDMILACVPRAFAGWFGSAYLRIPNLVGARLPLGDTMASTLAHATRTVRYDARRVLVSDYRWTLSRDLTDFEHFYDEFYEPFVKSRFGSLAVLRERQVLRRSFRHRGGLVWLRRADQLLGGILVQEAGHQLHALVQAIHPTYEGTYKPSAQFALNVALCDIALRRGLKELDYGSSVPLLSDGVVASKRVWGAIFEPSDESHRDILMRWPTPLRPCVQCFLHRTPLIFGSPTGLGALAAAAPGERVVGELVSQLLHQFVPRGVERLYVFGASGGGNEADNRMSPHDTTLADPSMDAVAINRLAAAVR